MLSMVVIRKPSPVDVRLVLSICILDGSQLAHDLERYDSCIKSKALDYLLDSSWMGIS